MSTAAPTASPPRTPEVKKSGGSWLGGLGHSLLGWPVEELLDGLRSPIEATRVEAASRLHRARGGVVPVAVACLDDPIPGVRYHALKALMGSAAGRARLVGVLTGGATADAAAREAVLNDLGKIHGAVEGARLATWLNYQYPSRSGTPASSNLFRDALAHATPGTDLLPLLAAAARCNLMPPVVASWRRGPRSLAGLPAREFAAALVAGPEVVALVTGEWPDRCCVCGATGPKATFELDYSGEVGRTPIDFNRYRVETVKGTLTVPVCESPNCQKQRPKVKEVSAAGVAVAFANPAFVADLIAGGCWSVAPPPEPYRREQPAKP